MKKNAIDKKLLAFCVVNLILVVLVGVLGYLSENARLNYNYHDILRAGERDEKITQLEAKVKQLEAKVENLNKN